MPDRSLSFSTDSVRGIQRALRGEPGAKWETRRLLSAKLLAAWAVSSEVSDEGVPLLERVEGSHEWVSLAEFAPIKPGDLVRVKHLHWMYHPSSINPDNAPAWDAETRVVRWANGDCIEACEPDLSKRYAGLGTAGWRKRSPMFMPAWASRYLLPIVSVRCERLQDITEQGAIDEGAMFQDGRTVNHVFDSALNWYRALWNNLHGNTVSYSWDANPLVFVYRWEEVRMKGSE